jgi:D-beta-D-heptose 7-phosphate kinase/D-beta-D-heptose 1-phosphate adenosyltransferase|tara:strand:+ start:1015 stop:1494 length:480 start_codon:yes stop_codon:yes gene_type:complete
MNKNSSIVNEEPKPIDLIRTWEESGYSIGFTNGCFDLIHPGHISLLHHAKNECDKLVVGLNSDSSVAKLKGKDRPIQKENARATVLLALKDVDIVIIFNEETPIKLIELIKPDVLIKGGDYKIDEIVGAEFIQQNGGRVVLSDYKNGHSTSDIIKKIES